MIVRPAADGTLLLITQPDHARLAAALIAGWTTDGPPAEWRQDVLLAIEQHDNGWREVDEMPTVEAATARPVDFTEMADPVKQAIWPRGVERLAGDSPLAAALVSQHALTLHARRRGDPGWENFFPALETLRARLLRACAADTDAASEAFERAYRLLHIGDVLSLVFCNRWKDPFEAGGYEISIDDEDQLLVSPDPFGGASVHFAVPARSIPDRRYTSDDDLRAAVARAPTLTLHGVARGAAEGRAGHGRATSQRH